MSMPVMPTSCGVVALVGIDGAPVAAVASGGDSAGVGVSVHRAASVVADVGVAATTVASTIA
eukprot:4073235-Alexandrium_andersonii.AAC.1